MNLRSDDTCPIELYDSECGFNRSVLVVPPYQKVLFELLQYRYALLNLYLLPSIYLCPMENGFTQ